jgi:hypothetical protein
MGIDIKKFKTAKFKDRTEEIKVDQLKSFFPKEDKPVWIIRAITGEEMYFVRAAVEKSRNIEQVLSQLVSGTSKQKAEAAVKVLGLDEKDLPEDYIRRLHILRYGSIDPNLRDEVEGLEICKKIAQTHPTLFNTLTDRIMQLTGLGKLGEVSASGNKQKSKVA